MKTSGLSAILVLTTLGAAVAAGTVFAARAEEVATRGTLAFDVTAKDGSASTYIVRTDGTGLRELEVDGLDPEDPAWSPDGSRIAFSDFDGLFVAGTGGGEAKKIDTGDEDYREDPRWSPDAERIVYERYGGIAIAQVSAGGHVVVPVPFEASDPDLSPKDGRLAFSSSESGEIYVIAGGGIRKVTRNGPAQWDSSVRWSPDGRSLLFIRETQRKVNGLYRTTDAIFTVSAAGGRPRRLMAGPPHNITSVTWSPDGRRIAYLAHPKIHVFDLATRTDRVFSPAPCRSVDETMLQSCKTLDWRRTLR